MCVVYVGRRALDWFTFFLAQNLWTREQTKPWRRFALPICYLFILSILFFSVAYHTFFIITRVSDSHQNFDELQNFQVVREQTFEAHFNNIVSTDR